MSMQIVFLKKHMEYKRGMECFVSRSVGRRLCQQEIAVPSSIKHYHKDYNAMIDEDRKKVKVIPKKKRKAKAVSKKAETRKKTIKK
jgi:hypothetical protein